MPWSQLPALLSAWLTDITAALNRRSAPRLLLLLVGALFAKGRRTVTSWFRAAGSTSDFRPAYNALWAAGRKADDLWQGADRPGQACGAETGLAADGLRAIRRAGGQDPQDDRGNLASPR